MTQAHRGQPQEHGMERQRSICVHSSRELEAAARPSTGEGQTRWGPDGLRSGAAPRLHSRGAGLQVLVTDGHTGQPQVASQGSGVRRGPDTQAVGFASLPRGEAGLQHREAQRARTGLMLAQPRKQRSSDAQWGRRGLSWVPRFVWESSPPGPQSGTAFRGRAFTEVIKVK